MPKAEGGAGNMESHGTGISELRNKIQDNDQRSANELLKAEFCNNHTKGRKGGKERKGRNLRLARLGKRRRYQRHKDDSLWRKPKLESAF